MKTVNISMEIKTTNKTKIKYSIITFKFITNGDTRLGYNTNWNTKDSNTKNGLTRQNDPSL